MSISLGANGGSYNYPQENDPAGWGDDATNWASAVSAALSNIGLGGTASADAVVNIISNEKGILIPRMTTNQRNAIGSPSTSLLIYNTTTTQYELYTGSTWQSLASYISGNLTVTGNTTLGDASGDTLTITGNAVSTPNGLNIDSNTLVVDATNNRIGVVTASPTVALDVTGDIKASSTIQSANGTATAPGITFSGDTNTGLYISASDQLSFSTGGNERFRIESTGQIKAVYESQVGTDYNTTLDNGYFCRAWVNFNGKSTVAIRASGNVSSITDNGTGDYTVNFTTAMPDSNYCPVSIGSQDALGNYPWSPTLIVSNSPFSVNSIRLSWEDTSGGSSIDVEFACVAVFR